VDQVHRADPQVVPAGLAARVARVAVVAALIAFSALGLADTAAARAVSPSRRPAVPVVQLRFARLGNVGVVINGPLILIGARTLIDERTDVTVTLAPPPGCEAVALGGPYVAANCGGVGPVTAQLPEPELYSIASGKWTAVTLAPRIAALCSEASPYSCSISGVGADWISVSTADCDHCAELTLFQNLATGQVSPDPTAVRTLPDLNSSTLASPICSPLRLPPSTLEDAGTESATLGLLDLDGRFGLSTSTTTDGTTTTNLVHCGSHVQTFICHCGTDDDGGFRDIGLNAAVAIWAPRAALGVPHLDGLSLATRRRFLIDLPAGVAGGDVGFQLSSRTLYVWNSENPAGVFAAPSPQLNRK
jgi:hypothetical protein